ncbi:MAG: 6,7-dimethyl-8-ribityllumazine synthase [Bacteroidota bacterium]
METSITYYQPTTQPDNPKVAIVVSKWNSMITDKLLAGAINALVAQGVAEDKISVVRCPGAFELPLATDQAIRNLKPDGVVALGVVIRGGTPHFEYVCDAVTRGILDMNLKYGVPVAFGVLTTDNVEQALERAGDQGNKGAEAALATLEMIDLSRKMEP